MVCINAGERVANNKDNKCMPRREYTKRTLRLLFARSGNQCAFPGCTHRLFNVKNDFIAQVCHIEAASPGGERYNPQQTDDERRSYENLMVMCYGHHIETNDVQCFPVERMKKIKLEHERIFEHSEYKVDAVALEQVVVDNNRYWTEIEGAIRNKRFANQLKFIFDPQGKFGDVVKDHQLNIDDLRRLIDEINDKVLDSASEIDFCSDQLPDDFQDLPDLDEIYYQIFKIKDLLDLLSVDLVHMEIKYLEEYLKTNARDHVARERLTELREAFSRLI